MISDVLSDAAAQIREYLADPVTAGCYSDEEIGNEIADVLARMDALREKLDRPPAH